MRRQLCLGNVQPLLAHFFHLMPWDYDRLTFDELNGFIGAIPKQSKG